LQYIGNGRPVVGGSGDDRGERDAAASDLSAHRQVLAPSQAGFRTGCYRVHCLVCIGAARLSVAVDGVPLAAVLAGILWKGTGKAVWRRLLFVVPCLLVAFYFPFRLMTGRTPECANLWWANRVCLQTSQATCSPAAAATLLKYHDIGASEEEMARLCLTRKNGTYLHGLYRGLRIKTRAAGYRVVVQSTELARLRSEVSLPVILNVKLTEAVNRRDPRYSKDWGWRVGVPHTVVLFRFTDGGRVRMGDPGVGHEHWDLQALRDLWHGEYIALETTK
jgi:hypothetical protein